MSDIEFPGADEPETVSPEPARPAGAGRIAARLILAVALGGTIAALGTATHRTLWHGLPIGLVLALALTASSGVLARAWAGLATLAGAAVGWLVVAQVLALPGQGGDVLVTNPNAALPVAWAGIAWTYGGVVALGVVAFLPRRWFARR
ncbi:hypothetical protein [Xylanimonas ulmi]|uniref:Uncharacterized protein n=1 Tax=Xylanimonas ulmi TaxID=228973 RepID=A0A4V2EY51_9MICO|nr:hypothetical protein [Xylanibacterium ulmi]RZS61770.1 hypothetical protein EV386_2081 [Xylanibacterium ulmi]